MVETNKTSENFRVKELIGLIGKIASEDLKNRRKKTDKDDPMNAIVGAVKNLRNEFKTFEKNTDMAENLSLESTNMLESLLNNTPAGIAFLEGPELRYFRINQTLADLNGLSIEDHLGKPLKEVLPNAKEALLPIMQKIIKDGKAVLGREFSITLPGDTDKPIHLVDYLFPIPDKHGKPIGVGAIVLNISERKEAEKERDEVNEKLKQSERMESLGVLAGGVAHDLNNTLVPLLAIPELMLSKLPKNSNLIDHINLIRRATERAADTVNDLLTLARRGRYTMVPLNINSFLDTVIKSEEFIDIQKQNPNVNHEYNMAKNLPNIKGSKSHLTQVVLNLVKNANEAMDGGGRLRIKTSKVYLATTLRAYTEIKQGDYVLLEIEDNGIGISDDDLRRIFEPFFTNKDMANSGSGLGLSVVWGVIKDHDANIDVQAALSSGTKFSIYFPITDEKEEEVSEEQIDISGTENILVVDDVKEQLVTLNEILSSLGYHVDGVKNGHLAVDFVKKNDVDLVILDMLLEEGFDGLDTYKEIRKIKPNQKAIIVSGFSETERVQHAMLYGVGKFVSKPYSVKKIGKAVREELDKK